MVLLIHRYKVSDCVCSFYLTLASTELSNKFLRVVLEFCPVSTTALPR